MLAVIVATLVSNLVLSLQERLHLQKELAARLSLPETSDLWLVTEAFLSKREGGYFVFSDGHALVSFSGRYRIALRDAGTGRHVFTPQWSPWIDYEANPEGTRYHQPETLSWWVNNSALCATATCGIPEDRPISLQTCWQARTFDSVLGEVHLHPVCVQSVLPVSNDERHAQDTAP